MIITWRVLIVGKRRMPNLGEACRDPIMVSHQMAAALPKSDFQKDKNSDFLIVEHHTDCVLLQSWFYIKCRGKSDFPRR